MSVVPVQDVFFDNEATLAMGAAFDLACSSLRYFARVERVRELVAKRIIEAAKNGERDPIRLHSQAIMGFCIDDMSMPDISFCRPVPSFAYAAAAHEA